MTGLSLLLIGTNANLNLFPFKLAIAHKLLGFGFG